MSVKLPCLLQLRILDLAVRSLFSRPYTSAYPAGPYEPIKEFRGRPRVDEGNCIGCGACAQVCPPKCIDLDDDAGAATPVRRLVQHLDQCICCGQCERYCTTEKGIRLTNEYDFAGFKPEDFEERVEKALVLCEGCDTVIAPLDQLRWLVRRLGPLAFANVSLMLVSHGQLALVDEGVKPPSDAVDRAQRVSILCPKCSRKSALAV